MQLPKKSCTHTKMQTQTLVTQKLLRTGASTNKSFYTRVPSHTRALQTEAFTFTARCFRTQSLYTEKPGFYTDTQEAFRHKGLPLNLMQKFLRAKAFTHTWSELSLRILLWNASGVQKTPTQHDTMRWTSIYRNVDIFSGTGT